MTDPIADMLTRIRNAQTVDKTEVVVPFSKMKLEIATILKQEGFIKSVATREAGSDGNRFDEIVIGLKYTSTKEPAITALKRISKPGERVYATKEQLPRVLNNLGIAIISTSHGLMTNKQARKSGLGGEVICEIY
ncbi:MAG: 30S ribosomal protein S8 [Candidatus Buchananbacteria bacterium RIFCSPHIGHO2_01_FULL_47_11b]|uniref:Small ribosomal subunit protein uS8 n=1 Tax=Candidatus Buchananbacteria bacterium RIFCSPHIGHO2_01_FULL_47_11b TaxID=1797537 RepID=A0A1G1Y2P4_9BACT|nr:MAG: 30S ribosomal protein S8 [Candidatus Buchananbacteria bacterium RIFCSPHIGHO2_01_FULL_47_11b]